MKKNCSCSSATALQNTSPTFGTVFGVSEAHLKKSLSVLHNPRAFPLKTSTIMAQAPSAVSTWDEHWLMSSPFSSSPRVTPLTPPASTPVANGSTREPSRNTTVSSQIWTWKTLTDCSVRCTAVSEPSFTSSRRPSIQNNVSPMKCIHAFTEVVPWSPCKTRSCPSSTRQPCVATSL